MPMNALDVDNSISDGKVKGKQLYDDARKKFMEPYNQAKANGLWYAYLEKSFPGIPGQMIEQKLLEANKTAYEATKKRFIDAIGGKNGTTNR
jgi:hypothetical protein